MIKYFTLALGIIVVALFCNTSCSKSNATPQTPVPQTIVQSDSSGFTGKLVVYFFYQDGAIRQPGNVSVQLYATHNDLIVTQNNPNTDLSIYSVNSGNSNYVNFGYIIQGNYYMFASTWINQVRYTLESVVQVLPQRYNERRMTLIPLQTIGSLQNISIKKQ